MGFLYQSDPALLFSFQLHLPPVLVVLLPKLNPVLDQGHNLVQNLVQDLVHNQAHDQAHDQGPNQAQDLALVLTKQRDKKAAHKDN